jgi:predicted small lipoprotein YifL
MKLCWAQCVLLLVVAVLATGSMLSACGQKGELTRTVATQNTAPVTF